MHKKGLRTTYRIQLHKDFNFIKLESILPYLHKLGIDTIYASPIFRSTPGSPHGYDGIDMQKINPEIGSLEDFRRIRKKLNQYSIQWLQDIVPNHMAFHPQNEWLMDLLEFGSASQYSRYFDTCYDAAMFTPGKLMVPILGKEIVEVIKDKEIAVILHQDKLCLRYFDNCYPLNPESYYTIFETHLKKTQIDFSGFLVQVNTAQANGDQQNWQELRKDILSGISETELNEYLQLINDTNESLQDLINTQFYDLCPWWETNYRINYRRFFTVNGLICLNVHLPEVFEATHRAVKELIEEGLIDGLRIDHIDGLFNPDKYLKQLRAYVGPDVYIVAEKILEQREELPRTWPIQGTTGYEFLSACNNLFSCKKGKKKLNSFYKQLPIEQKTLKKQQLDKKKQILTQHMRGDVDNLVNLVVPLLNDYAQINKEQLTKVLQAFLSYFPVYRIYDDRFPLSRGSYDIITDIFKSLKKISGLNASVVEQLWQVFKVAQEGGKINKSTETILFLQRCMQFTGPVMAKGVEDTLMYTYNRFIGHNEVGDHPSNFGIGVNRFHKLMQKRQSYWPLSLNTTATHDTKRGEDTRSRLSVLTALASEWIKQVQIWQDIVRNEYRGDLPHSNDEYFIYQALVGSCPIHFQEKGGEKDFEQRFLDYLVKYLREGKERSNWEEPDNSYESTVRDFASFLLNKKGPFFTSFYQFFKQIVDYGIVNSLAQQLLKFTCPGVPDTYQGSELWNFSFVDPDNRRPVDYKLRKSLLESIYSIPENERIATLWREREDGRIKLWLISELTQIRKNCSALSYKSSYIKLKIRGTYKKNILAFARKSGKEWLVIVVPLHLAAIGKSAPLIPSNLDWGDTYIKLPARQPVKWQHLLAKIEGEETEIAIDKLFVDVPLALIRYTEVPKTRTAGVLMHLSSLPSPYGIGTIGKEARRFVNQLQASGQSWWQMLPIGPTAQAQCHSPYSTLSAWAGNPLFIDLEVLGKENLLTKEELNTARGDASNMINFETASAIKYQLLTNAYQRSNVQNEMAFLEFCQDESTWLKDFACFMVLKEKYNNLPWSQWPEKYKYRDNEALRLLEAEHAQAIQMVKWWQYIFFQQWQELKHYSTDHGIRLLGDLPFYVNYDSVDVWVNPQFFAIGESRELKALAGVPPDYFNDQGQLWGMPVYQWEVLKADGYQWWINRLRHTCKLFDQVRLDHFRAFSSFWEVSAEQPNARDGRWSPGPGIDFFDKVKAALGKMPFVAEDLGDVDAKVYELRDRYHFPGMKVLQFAFGNDMANSPHIPHQYGQNFIAYTGTHDNNTTLSWYNQDIDQYSRSRINDYLGSTIDPAMVNNSFIRALYASVADTVIIPMQDILNLDGSCRMNRPASTAGNWLWRMEKQAYQKKIQKQLRKYVQLYNR